MLTTVRGRVLVAWQAWRDGQADILLAPVDDPAKPINVSNHPADDWSPAVAAGPSGVYRRFDSYRNGNYDVFLASLAPAGEAEPTITAVANSSKFEARPTLAVDSRGRAWVAYEERWRQLGQGFRQASRSQGIEPLCFQCREGAGRRRDPSARDDRSGVRLGRARDRTFNSFPRLTLDGTGRPWLLYRHRIEWSVFGGAVFTAGPIWIEFATTLAGKAWTPPQPLPRSDNLLDNRPALVARSDGGILAVLTRATAACTANSR